MKLFLVSILAILTGEASAHDSVLKCSGTCTDCMTNVELEACYDSQKDQLCSDISVVSAGDRNPYPIPRSAVESFTGRGPIVLMTKAKSSRVSRVKTMHLHYSSDTAQGNHWTLKSFRGRTVEIKHFSCEIH